MHAKLNEYADTFIHKKQIRKVGKYKEQFKK